LNVSNQIALGNIIVDSIRCNYWLRKKTRDEFGETNRHFVTVTRMQTIDPKNYRDCHKGDEDGGTKPQRSAGDGTGDGGTNPETKSNDDRRSLFIAHCAYDTNEAKMER